LPTVPLAPVTKIILFAPVYAPRIELFRPDARPWIHFPSSQFPKMV
jgi:hypothetical protein